MLTEEGTALLSELCTKPTIAYYVDRSLSKVLIP